MNPLDPARAPAWSLRSVLREAATLGLVLALVLIASRAALAPKLRLDFVSWAAVYFALERPLLRGLGLTVCAGYWAEVFSGDSRGVAMFATVGMFLLLRLGVVRLIGAGWLAVTSLSVIATLGALVLRWFAQATLGPGAMIAEAWPRLPGMVLGAALLGYPMFRLMAAIGQRFQVRDDFIFRSRGSW